LCTAEEKNRHWRKIVAPAAHFAAFACATGGAVVKHWSTPQRRDRRGA